MSWFKNFFNGSGITRTEDGNDYFFKVESGLTNFDTLASRKAKLAAVLSSPAALSVFKIQCDLFSLGRIEEKDNPDSTAEILKKLKQPNPFQGQRQFLWDFMFYLMLGSSYMEANSKVISDDNNIYWLNSGMIEFPQQLLYKLDKQYWSKEAVEALGEEQLKLYYSDGSHRKIKLKKLETFADLTNSTGNWFGGSSALDALYKIVSNSEAALDAKAINLDFAGKFIVSGDNNSDNVYEQNLSAGEKKSVEDVVKSGKKVTAVKSRISIARFVDNIAHLELDKAYFADYFKIGRMYGIPREVLEANLDRGATFENQAVARASYVEFTLKPKGGDLTDGLKHYFNLNIDLDISWEHLDFTHVTKKIKLDGQKLMSQTIVNLRKAGVSEDSINSLLGIDVTFNDKE